MSGVFISYRRDDTGGYVGRLSKDLEHRLRGDKVFFDIDDIKGGDNFVSAIDEALDECYVFLPVIGKNWLHIQDASGNRRLDHADDYVRLEICSALRRTDVRVIPILAGGASMPSSAQLPDEISSLAQHHALKLHNESWEHDVEKLNNAILQTMGVSQSFCESPGRIDISYLGEWIECSTISCSNCGAEIFENPDMPTELCVLCSGRIEGSSNINKFAKPAFVRSFQISRDKSIEQLRQLLKENTFAPDEFKQLKLKAEMATPIFVPHWCFKVETNSEYSGKIGTEYTVKEPRKVIRDGNEVVDFSDVTKIDWRGVVGRVDETFEFCTSGTMPLITGAQTDFNHEALAVHKSTDFTSDSVVMATNVPIEDALHRCKEHIDENIKRIAEKELSGDKTEVEKIGTIYKSVTSKLILLPRWHYTVRYKGKDYLLTVDGMTGYAEGDTPISKVKASLGIALATVVIGTIAFLVYHYFFSS